MPILLADVTLLAWDSAAVRAVDVGVGDDGRIAWIEAPGAGAFPEGAAVERLDAHGMLCTPALVVAHHHLYSALAPGMPPPPSPPGSFVEILEQVWWRLDRCFDADLARASAGYGALAAARLGAGTVIDHHASPGFLDGSLDAIAEGIARVGLRGVLCYEVTDRHGHDEALAGVAENLRFHAGCAARQPAGGVPRFAGLLGGHASFTMDDATLDALAEHASLGLHIHVCEDAADRAVSQARHGATPVERLRSRDLLNPRSLVAHGVHLTRDEVTELAASGATLVHNYRSNWINSVGVPRPELARAARVPLALGTDGMDGDLLAELKAGFYANQAAHLGRGWEMAGEYLTGNAALAGRYLPGLEAASLRPGAPADLTLWRYPAAATIEEGRGLGHLLFGLHSGQVHGTMVGGRWAYLDGRHPIAGDTEALLAEAREQMRVLWGRMEALPA